MEISVYSFSHQGKSRSSTIIEQMMLKHKPISVLLIDLLTIAIGTKHHDIHLLSAIKGNYLGRILFDVKCEQIENIAFTINSLNIKLNYSIQNQISFRLKYIYEENINETMFTLPIKNKLNTKDSTLYTWVPNEKQGNPLKFNKVMLSVNELQNSNLEIELFEANFSEQAENDEKEKGKDNDIKSEDTFFKRVPKNNTVEKYDYEGNLYAKKQHIEDIDFVLLANFNEIGYARISFYNLLNQKDFLLPQQISQCFHRFSYLFWHQSIENKTESLNLTQHNLGNKMDSITNFDNFQNHSHIHAHTRSNGNIEKKKIGKSKSNFVGKSKIRKSNFEEKKIEDPDIFEQDDCEDENFQIVGENLEKEVKKEKPPKLKKGHTVAVPEHISKILTKDSEDKKLSRTVFLKLVDERTQIEFKETISFSGKDIGEVEGVIVVEHIPLLNQIMCGVHTEKGLDLNTNDYYMSEHSLQTDLPMELKKISDLNLQLTQSILNFTLKQNVYSYRELNDQLTKVLQNILEPLRYRDNEGNLRYHIKTEFDLIRAPQILLNLGLTVINSLDSFNIEQRTICFEILGLINSRVELSLKSLSLLTNIDNDVEKNKLKIKVIESFLDFMTHTLDNTLEKLSKKFNDEKTKGFISNFLVVAYFRLPMFQKEFLKALNPSYEQKSEEIKNYNYIFDWGELFYSRLKKVPGINLEEKEKELEKILEKSGWRDRIRVKGVGFYSILSHFDNYLYSRYEKNQELNLDAAPGITVIKNSIIAELENKPVYSYPQSLIDILSVFIYNANDMNRFYKVIISKTNAYDSISVFTAIKILDSFFEAYLENKNSTFSHKFDYTLLKRPFNIVIEIDNGLCIAKYLWLFYKNVHIMSIIQRSEMITDILANYFFILFFHWSWEVRDIFYHLLFYIISHRLKSKNFMLENKNLFEERMSTLKSDDIEGFYKTVHSDCYEQIKKAMLSAYYAKLRIIEMVRSIVRKEKLDPNFNSNFTTQSKDLNVITEKMRPFVVASIFHYDVVEKGFRDWERKNKNNQNPEYPKLTMNPPKDDYTEYNSQIGDQW